MKKYERGTTIVEILISIIIISIVMALLFNMFLQVRSEDTSNQIQSNFVINQSTFIKEVEEDIVNYGVKSVSSCEYREANVTSIVTGSEAKYYCVKLEYAADYVEDNIGFLMLYNTYARYDVENGQYKGQSDSARWMIQYVRGHYEKYIANNLSRPDYTSWKSATHVMKEYPSAVLTNENITVKYTASTSTNAAAINLPIVSDSGEHYDINLSLVFTGNTNFKCLNNNSNVKTFKCECLSSQALCQPTYN